MYLLDIMIDCLTNKKKGERGRQKKRQVLPSNVVNP